MSMFCCVLFKFRFGFLLEVYLFFFNTKTMVDLVGRKGTVVKKSSRITLFYHRFSSARVLSIDFNVSPTDISRVSLWARM